MASSAIPARETGPEYERRHEEITHSCPSFPAMENVARLTFANEVRLVGAARGRARDCDWWSGATSCTCWNTDRVARRVFQHVSNAGP